MVVERITVEHLHIIYKKYQLESKKTSTLNNIQFLHDN